ncbi:OsmC family protein [Desulfogranum mediterraneum]|uniref:OsmC family protein n=1 Tax=Desulfogranum mediterraneum TaxID=160661 RepID=UPI000409599A|nr:OsmC family protein [Desulfogranum mediterraneum]
MKNSISVDWEGGLAFSTAINGHPLTIDANEEFGGNNAAPNPKSLMMMALAGCTGIDVVSILKKMKIGYEHLAIQVDADLSEEHPKVYTAMHLTYIFRGRDLDSNRLQRAIDLSLDKYCGVSAMYRQAMSISHSLKIIDTKKNGAQRP